MSTHHQLSPSLFHKLFKHNMVTSDGFITATDAQIIQFRKFLVQEAAQKTAAMYEERKQMVDEVLSLLCEERLNPLQRRKLTTLLHKLNMKVTEDGTIVGIHQNATGNKQPESLLSDWECKIEKEEKKLRELKHDLHELNEWLREISVPSSNSKSESEDDRARSIKQKSSKKKVPKTLIGVRPKKSSFTTAKRETGSTRANIPTLMNKALQRSKQKGDSTTNSKEKILFRSKPRESFDAMLYHQESKRTTLQKISIRRKGSFDRDSISNELGQEGSCPVALSKVDSSQSSELGKEDSCSTALKVYSGKTIMGKKARLENKFKTHPQESFDAMLGNEKSKRTALKKISIRKKGSFNRDSISSELSKEGSRPAALSKVDSSQSSELSKEDFCPTALKKIDSGKIIIGKSAKLKNKNKIRVFRKSNHSKTRARKGRELVSQVFDVQKVTSSENQVDEEKSLLKNLKLVPKLQKCVFENETAQSIDDDDYDEYEGTWNEGVIVFHTKKLTVYSGNDTKMGEDLIPAKLEPTLDEILRKEEEKKIFRKRHYQIKQ